MIKPLRKYHFILWHVWAILLPLAFIISIAIRPHLPDNITYAKDMFVAELNSLTDSTSVVQISVTKPLNIPSCIAFHVIDGKEILLGKLGHPGAYTFVIPKSEKDVSLKLYDAIHKETITSISLTSKK